MSDHRPAADPRGEGPRGQDPRDEDPRDPGSRDRVPRGDDVAEQPAGPPPTAAGRTAGVSAQRRLAGVDVARGTALVAMMAVHVLPAMTPGGDVSVAYLLASGRAAALFAVLAGVGLALSTGRSEPLRGGALSGARRALLGRAAVVVAVGLTLGLVYGNIAVILVNYGLLFVAATLVLGLRARSLLVLAPLWLVLAPVLSQAVRPLVPATTFQVPSWASLADPLQLLSELLLTGYYPVLVWSGYLLAGMAVGRLALGTTRVAAALLVGGAVLAVVTALASDALVRAVGGVAHFAALLGPGGVLAAGDLADALRIDLYGATPTTSWTWLLVRSPHSGTPFDLLHTTGCALAVLGACLLLVRWRPAALLLAPVAAAGAMTLTLYSLHVLATPPLGEALGLVTGRETDVAPLSYALQVVAVLLLASAWRLAGRRGLVPRRGPLEELAAGAADAARGGRG